MWTTENRYRYDRDKLRYPSDLTDAEWRLIAPLIPPAKRGGGKRTRDPQAHPCQECCYMLEAGQRECPQCGFRTRRQPAVITVEDAVKPGAPAVWDEAPNNISFTLMMGNKNATDTAFAPWYVARSEDKRRVRLNQRSEREYTADRTESESRNLSWR